MMKVQSLKAKFPAIIFIYDIHMLLLKQDYQNGVRIKEC